MKNKTVKLVKFKNKKEERSYQEALRKYNIRRVILVIESAIRELEELLT